MEMDELAPDPLKETQLPPQLQEWARQQFPKDEFLRGLQEIQECGGATLSEFFDELLSTVRHGGERA
jgi:hypothetical protein